MKTIKRVTLAIATILVALSIFATKSAAFTKADLASEDDLINMRDAIEDSFDYYPDFHFIPVCSKKRK